MGRQTAVRLLEFGYCEAPAPIAGALKLKPGERVQSAVRVRVIDSEPFSFLVTHVPERLGMSYTGPELASRPLLALLERAGVKAARATQDVTAALAAPDVAAALGIRAGSPLIGLTRTVFAEDGTGIEHLSALYRPDLYTLRMEMERKVSVGVARWSAAAVTERAATAAS
jgi:GntR family transcriptional regulator